MKIESKSLNILSEKLKELKEIIPEAFTEDKIDWEKLKIALGENINFQNERYNLNWAGKSEAFRVLQQRTSATLKPIPEDSNLSPFTKGGDKEGVQGNAENLFIEGENLEILKVLQKSYFGKIKMIYIDPPYNTGNDSFIYPDKFSESKDEYLKRIGDKSEEGYLLKEGFFRKNSKDGGHYHSNWLSMMYPRLYIARNLLKDDGVIFVSIDDNEVHNLRMIMNEIFGEENFVGQIINKSNPRGSQEPKGISTEHEYIICYTKSEDGIHSLVGKEREKDDAEFNYLIENNINARLLGLRKRGGAWKREDRPNMYYPFYVNPKNLKVSLKSNSNFNIKVFPIRPDGSESRWTWGKETASKRIKELIAKEIKRNNEIIYDIYRIDRLIDDEGNKKREKIKSIWDFKELNYQHARSYFKNFFGSSEIFDFPKPPELIKKLIESVIMENDIILDFFAGSGTTAQAVLELNKEDGGNRKFILVQLPEKTDENSEAYKAGFKTIADICKERIRRVISLTPNPSPAGEGLFDRKMQNDQKAALYRGNLFKGAQASLFVNAKQMRLIDTTEAENKLWQVLRNKQIENCKFRRQHPIGDFIADFYCHEKKLIIEVDGGYHNKKEQKEYDNLRTKTIKEFGVDVIRFTNDEVLNYIETVIKKIKVVLSSFQSPLLEERGKRGEVGFKVFKLSPSNFKHWRSDIIESEEDLDKMIDLFDSQLKPGAKELNMLYELMLKSGYTLTEKIEHKKEFYLIADKLAVVLNKINQKIIDEILKTKPQSCIILDDLFADNDQLKTNTALQMKDAGVELVTV